MTMRPARDYTERISGVDDVTKELQCVLSPNTLERENHDRDRKREQRGVVVYTCMLRTIL